MRILQLCKKFPYPLKDGESIAVTYLSKALQDLGCEMTLLCMNTTKHYTELKTLPKDFNHYKEILVTKLDNAIKPVDAFKNLFSKESYHVSRFVSKEFEEELIRLLERKTFDVIQLETLYLAPYIEIIRQHSDALITMRAHNVEHEIWERITQNTKLLPKKWYLGHLAKKLKNYEISKLNDYDYLITVTDKDLKKFKKLGYRNGAASSPIGIDVSDYNRNKLDLKHPLSMCFIGSLDWMPNLEGLDWFLEHVWPKVKATYPNLKMHVAGRNTPSKIKQLEAGELHIHGEVASAIRFISDHPIMIVPLFSGSGMRVKILEGLALGRIIITTSMGLEGIDARHMQEVMIADTPEEFMQCIEFCHNYPSKLKSISKNAKSFVKQHYDNQNNASELKDLYQKLLIKYRNKNIEKPSVKTN